MYLHKIVIEKDSFVNDLVKQDHHSADVFRKYGIAYCCGGKWPLVTVCINHGLEYEVLKKELEHVCRTVQLPPAIDYDGWSTDFLVSYILNIYHPFLRNSISDTAAIINEFAEGHKKQYPAIQETVFIFQQLREAIMSGLEYEQGTLFPYILQITHAHDNGELYAKLLVKTLGKPMCTLMTNGATVLPAFMETLRRLTNNYSPPEKACVSHILSLKRLKELDNNLTQYVYLKNDVLLSRALRIEAELLQ